MSWQWEGGLGSGFRLQPGPARSQLPAPGELACMHAGPARAGGSPGVRRRGPASASLLFPASGTPACSWGALVVGLLGERPPPSFGLEL